jgi:glycerol kinase
VRAFEKKLEDEGIDIDDEDEPLDGVPDQVEMGTGTDEAAIGDHGEIEEAGGEKDGIAKAMETLGFAGRGKDGAEGAKRKRKGKDGLVDV